jgi:peptide/histidine transporter 3/4
MGNLVLFLNMSPLSWLSYNATSALFILTGLTYAAGLIGGWISDAYLGKFKTMLIFFLIYIIGYSLFPALAKDGEGKDNTSQMWCDFNSHANHTPHNGSQFLLVDLAATERKPMHSEGCSAIIFFSLTIIAIGTGVVRVNLPPFGADQVVIVTY